MLFNSLQFLVFFPIVIILYWLLPGKFRNPFLLIASYYFYMNWQPAYALLILFSSVTTWAGALYLSKDKISDKRKKSAFIATLVINLGILFCFKYLGFAGNEVRRLIDYLGIGFHVPEFEILLPVGISFFTFQAIGYLIDVWRKNINPERNFFTYALFVSFFPQLVAGPIERASNLLPQFHYRHIFNSSLLIKGIELMIMGYFMKLCIAENVAPYVDAVYNNITHHNGTSILLATFFFTFQIFCDFGGYSLIAIGAARCMGFSLMQNFRQPYLALSVKDFWRRWHISLSTWFSDYVYIPLGGNRVKPARHYGNLFTTFLVSGIWHGANYTFIAWGAYHGVLQCINVAWHKVTKKRLPDNLLTRCVKIIFTFILMMLGWVFFRANSISDAFTAFHKMATDPGMLYNGEGKPAIAMALLLIMLLMGIEISHEYHQSTTGDPLPEGKKALFKSAFLSAALVIIILLTAKFTGGQFIYFQF